MVKVNISNSLLGFKDLSRLLPKELETVGNLESNFTDSFTTRSTYSLVKNLSIFKSSPILPSELASTSDSAVTAISLTDFAQPILMGTASKSAQRDIKLQDKATTLGVSTFPTEISMPQATLTLSASSGERSFIAPPQEFLQTNDPNIISGLQSNLITVNYTGFTAQAQVAFQFAVDIWNSLIATPVPIKIDAKFEALGPGVLGSAGPFLARNFTGAPQANTFYPLALANQFANTDLNSTNPEITASFSNSFNFYFGLDGNVGNGQFDFVSVVLHEIGHGLGFVAADSYNNNGTLSTADDTASLLLAGSSLAFGKPYENSAGTNLLTGFVDGSNALALQFISNNIFYNSPKAVAANGGNRPKMFAPATYQDGSSISHLDETTFAAGNPNSLMTPAIGPQEVIQNPGAITLAMFEDLGWGRVRTGVRGARDTLTGTTNRDVITGGLGSDNLTGGLGADNFVYNTARDGIDTITDFTVAQADKLDFRGLATNLGQTGNNLISLGYLSFVDSGSNAIVRLDQDAAGLNFGARSYITVNGITASALNQSANFIF
jgi:hypothetical protein